jgi:hypothetical protein
MADIVNGSGQNEQSLERTFHRCFLPSFTSFGWGVSEEKIKMWKVNGRQTPSDGKISHCLWQGELTSDRKINAIIHKCAYMSELTLLSFFVNEWNSFDNEKLRLVSCLLYRVHVVCDSNNVKQQMYINVNYITH